MHAHFSTAATAVTWMWCLPGTNHSFTCRYSLHILVSVYVPFRKWRRIMKPTCRSEWYMKCEFITIIIGVITVIHQAPQHWRNTQQTNITIKIEGEKWPRLVRKRPRDKCATEMSRGNFRVRLGHLFFSLSGRYTPLRYFEFRLMRDNRQCVIRQAL